jgi:cytochrome P450 family 4
MSRFALNTVIETALGIKLDESADGDKYRSNVYEIGAQFVYRFVRPWLFNDFMYKVFGNGRKVFKVLDEAHEFTRKIVRQRRMTFHEERKEYDDLQNENV